jgi:DNA polymerase (family 10)
MTIKEAIKVGDAVLAALGPYCQRIEIAGSIRRARDPVGDVDVVCLPHPGQEAGLRSRAKAKSRAISEGDHSLIVETANGVQVDIWFAAGESCDLLTKTPSTWGTVLLCRTGSKEHNISLCTLARAQGMRWDPPRGLFRGDALVASDSEHAIFEALGLRFIPPALREAGLNHIEWSLPKPSPMPLPSSVSPRDAARMFADIKARCASAGNELERRCLGLVP